ncbi:MAG: ABC transporter ATP-binding protein [Myxococcales bacterium]
MVDAARVDKLIEVRGLHKVYMQDTLEVPVLSGIELSIGKGEVVALVGPSGSGKSTLLNLLGCLDRPTSGHYFLGGRDVSLLTRAEQAWVRLHYLGFVFQGFHLLPTASALENVALPLFYAGVDKREREERARVLLTRVGLGERCDHRPNQLSGGQRQRVAIARALANRPRLLLADEPTGALDQHSGEEVLGLLDELHNETGLSMLIVTHDAKVARTAKRVIVLRDGRIIRDQPGGADAILD